MDRDQIRQVVTASINESEYSGVVRMSRVYSVASRHAAQTATFTLRDWRCEIMLCDYDSEEDWTRAVIRRVRTGSILL